MSVPESMPYTYEEVFNCKTRSLDELKKDFKSLVNFKADVNPRKFCGNKILYHYQMKNLLACRRGNPNWKTLKEWFDDDELKEQLWKDSIVRNRRDKSPYPSPTDVYECHRLNNGSIVFFKSSTAKYIYKLFNAKNVLDPTAGWGGRMLAAMSLGINYTGIDTNINMKEAYKDLKYVSDQILNGKEFNSENTYLFFDTMKDDDGRYLSEDYAFSRRWQKLGGKIYADIGSTLTHVGPYKYTGHLWKHFNIQKG